MATLNNKISGDFTAAATWGLVDSGTLLDSEASSSSASTTWTSVGATTVFTPGAITTEGIGVKLLNRTASSIGNFSVRVVPQGSIASVSIANPTTITTTVAHGLSTGDTITIAGTVTAASTTGSFTATVTGATTFTIPVNVTVVTTGTGTWTRNLAVITSNSVAASTIVATGVHGITVGSSISVTISGNVGSSPSINGTFLATSLTTSTFSIPVTTTVGGTGGVFHINSGSPNTTVSISASDLPSPGTSNAGSCSGWFFFKFPSNVTFNALAGYAVQIASFTNAGVTAYTNGTASNWSRYLRLTTTQAPAATDVLYVTGDYSGPASNNTYTVTMDNTAATVFGKLEMSGKGILSYGVAASTAYQLICNGNVITNGDGEFRIGTSGARLPASSTAVMQINQGGVNVTNGFANRGTGLIQTWGNSKTWRTTLVNNVAIAGTSLTSTDTTGWTTGEDILIASTTRTAGETELRTLAVDSSGTTITVPAVTFAHSGAGDTQAELANITRNIKIRGESTTIQAYMQAATDGVWNCNDTEFQFMGSGTANRRGTDVLVIVGGLGSYTVKDCVIKNFEVASSIPILMNQATQTACVVDGCIFYRTTAGITTGATTTNTGITINNTWMFSTLSSATQFNLAMQGGTVTNCRAISSTGIGFAFSGLDNTGLTVSNLIAHSNATTGISIGNISSSNNPHLFTGLSSWRNTTRGILISASSRLSIDTITAFGNVTDGIELSQCCLVDISNATINGGVTLVQPVGILLGGHNTNISINSSSIGATSAHTTSSMSVNTTRQWHDISLRNCLLADATELALQTNMAPGAYIGSSRHDQTNGTHKMWRKYGLITADSTINLYPPLSTRSTPSNATNKLNTMERRFAVPSGKTAKIGVYVRRSVAGDGTAYNGNLPRLILEENTAAGITSNTVLATASAASLGAWELINGTTVAATNNTFFSVYIDCDGTTGWVNSDQWRIEIINGSANGSNINSEDYWTDGYSIPGINTTLTNNSGTDTYWLDGAAAQDLFPISNAQTGRFFLLFN